MSEDSDYKLDKRRWRGIGGCCAPCKEQFMSIWVPCLIGIQPIWSLGALPRFRIVNIDVVII